MHAQNGSLAEQLRRSEEITVDLAARSDAKTPVTAQQGWAAGLAPVALERGTEERRPVAKPKPVTRPAPAGDDLQFWNGYGGFAEDGSYVVRINNRTTTPHPWINVIANPDFGFHVSAEGSAFLPGRAIAVIISLPRGQMIRSPTVRARRSIFLIVKRAAALHQRRMSCATKLSRMKPATWLHHVLGAARRIGSGTHPYCGC